MRRALLSTFITLALLGCGSEEPDRQATAGTEQEGFIRLPAGGASMTAAYLTVTPEADDRLVGATVEGVRRTELHTVREVDGISQMRPVEGYEVEAGEPLVLEPGGHHLMLIGIEETMEEGAERTVTLRFESGAEDVINLPIRRQQVGTQDRR